MITQGINTARDNCVLDNSLFEKHFLYDLELAQNIVGRIDNYHSMHHIEYGSFDIAAKIGSEAIKIIEDTSYRNWNETVDDKLPIWQRLVWRFSLMSFIGYIIENHHVHFGKTNWSWDPGRENIGGKNASDLKIKSSGRYLNPCLANVSTYLRVFSDSYTFSGAMQGQAMIDAFDPNGSRVNPIRNAFKRAAKKSLYSIRVETLPLWWKRVLNDYGILEEFDKERNEERPNDNVEFNTGVAQAQKGQSVQMEPSRDLSNDLANLSKPSKPFEGSNPSVIAFRELIEGDSVNSKGCLMIKYDNQMWVKYPKILKDIENKTELSKEEVAIQMENVFETTKDGEGFRFKIEPDGKVVGSMSLAKLKMNNAQIDELLASHQNNTDLRLEKEL